MTTRTKEELKAWVKNIGVGVGAPMIAEDGSGNPQIVSLSSLGGGANGGATLSEQQSQTTLLNTIANASLPDKETPYITFKCNTAFAGASTGDIIAGILTINTVTNALVSNTPIWYNFNTQLPITVLDATKLTAIAANSLTAAELATMTLAIGATARVCVSHQGITVPITTGVTLASLCSGGVIPTGAVTCELQAQNGIVRYRLDASTVTPTTGAQINASETYIIDSVLASVRVVAETTAVSCSAKFFDKV